MAPSIVDERVPSLDDVLLEPVKAYNQISQGIDRADAELQRINKVIWGNPELGYQEHQAHDNCVELFRQLGSDWTVTPHAYGLETAYEAEFGSGGRLVNFNCEFDALPGIGHACGHNLIATSSIAAGIGLASALKAQGAAGRVRVLGTPAEEGGGGKVKLLRAGAYKGVDASLMSHPAPYRFGDGITGVSGTTTLANYKIHIEYRGRSTHAAASPWDGVNALDAAVLAYNNVSVLRQQLLPEERVHGVIEEGGTVPNVITEYSRSNYYLRSPTMTTLDVLKDKIMACFEAAATATRCKMEITWDVPYKDLRPNETICNRYEMHMKTLGSPVAPINLNLMGGSTDMGMLRSDILLFD